jgi:ribosomal protein L18E
MVIAFVTTFPAISKTSAAGGAAATLRSLWRAATAHTNVREDRCLLPI